MNCSPPRANIDKSLIMVKLSQKIGAMILAQGIEAESELLTWREMSVRLAPPVVGTQEGVATAR